ncbi:MAG TPA: neutral zinc metallopeptidase, partial [Gemmatimonadaceae bacterium]|nr:neutral zinc metallopeptidase [Gemmatimonadaceae bacterium]
MRWTPGGKSGNIEDRRGSGGGFGGMAPMGIGGTIIVLVLSLIFGRDFVGGSGGDTSAGPRQTASGDVAPAQQSPEEAREVQFVSFVLDSAQAVWS